MRKKVLSLGLTIGVILSCNVSAENFYFDRKFDPSLEWHTIETANFCVHFVASQKKLAQRAANTAEEVHEILTQEMKWIPNSKTQIIINSIEGGGFADSPLQTIYISDLQCGDDDLRSLIAHEYTHLLHIGTVEGVSKVFRKIFGRRPYGIDTPLFYPNVLQPVWITEGIAEFYGRDIVDNPGIFDVEYDAILRTAVSENKLIDISQGSTHNYFTWPGFVTPYVYGFKMFEYISSNYGKEKISELSHQYARQWIPFFVNYSANKVLDKSYYKLWKECMENIQKTYTEQIDKITKDGITPTRSLTKRGCWIGNAVFSPCGKYIAYVEDNNDKYPALKLMDAEGTNDRTIIKRYMGSLSWSPDGKEIVYARCDIYKNFNTYSDLYIFNLDSEKESRLTYGLRATAPDWSPDGSKIIFVSFQEDARQNISLFDLKTKTIKSVTDSQDGTQYYGLHFSPDGRLISAIIVPKELNSDIYLLDTSGSIVKQITSDSAMESSPAWSHDGKILFYTSSRDGTSNIYAYKLDENKTFKVTNVIGAAEMGSVSPCGKKLVFSNLSSIGYDLHLIDLEKIMFREVSSKSDTDLKQKRPVKSNLYPEHKYSPFSNIFPKFWFPVWGVPDQKGSQNGIITSWRDALSKHAYDVYATYGDKTSRWEYNIGYINDEFLPTISLGVSDNSIFYTDLLKDPNSGKEIDYWKRQEKASLYFDFPINISIDSKYNVGAGYEKRKVYDVKPLEGKIQSPSVGDMNNFKFSVGFSNVKKYPFSISKTSGREINLSSENQSSFSGSDYNINRYLIKWAEYIPMVKKHDVLMLKLDAGRVYGDTILQSEFQLDNGIGNFMPEDKQDILFEPFILRGYPSEFSGRKATVVTTEYRFPLVNIERGYGTWPIFLNRLHGALFADYGNAWNDKLNTAEFKTAVGFELRTDFMGVYRVPITFKFGYAKGLNEKHGGEDQIIFGLDYGF